MSEQNVENVTKSDSNSATTFFGHHVTYVNPLMPGDNKKVTHT